MGDLLTLNVGGVRTIYGTNTKGGMGGGGSAYRLTEIEPNSNLWRTASCTPFLRLGSDQGWAPMTGLTADAAGNLYGTTNKGGLGCGTVFKLSPANTALHNRNPTISGHTLSSTASMNPSRMAASPPAALYSIKLETCMARRSGGASTTPATVYEIIP